MTLSRWNAKTDTAHGGHASLPCGASSGDVTSRIDVATQKFSVAKMLLGEHVNFVTSDMSSLGRRAVTMDVSVAVTST